MSKTRLITSARSILSSDGFVTLVVAAAAFTDTFLYDLVVPFMPQLLRSRFGMPADAVQRWTSFALAIFGGAQLVSTLLVAAITDRLSSKQTPFMIGLVILSAAVLMLFLGTNIAWVMSARALQGLSTALVWVSGLAYLSGHVQASNMGRCMGFVTLGLSLGELVGPLAGGVLYDFAGRDGVLGLSLGVLGIDATLRLLLRERAQHKPHESLGDTERLLDESQDQSARNYSSVSTRRSERAEHGDADNNASTESDTDDMKRSVIADRWRLTWDVGTSWWATLITGIVRTGLESTLPLFVSSRFGWSTSASGATMFALLCPTVLSPVVGEWVGKHGPRWVNVVGFAVQAAALLALVFLQKKDLGVEVGFVVSLVVVGTCSAALVTAFTVAFGQASKISEQEKEGGSGGKIFGSMTIAYACAILVGPLIADAVMERAGWQAFCLLLAALDLLSAIISAFSWRTWKVFE